MMPIGPLMTEHRVIERMGKLIHERGRAWQQNGAGVDIVFVNTAVDFIRTYAERCHHGKEEAIMFRDLLRKPIKPEDKGMIEELVREHQWSRETTNKLAAAADRHLRGDSAALAEMTKHMLDLAHFYPEHIEKEDKHFFVPSMAYFTREEQNTMLDEFWEFDRQVIHDRYLSVVRQYESL